MIPYFISHTTFHFLYTMHPPQHSHADPPPADPDLLRFSSTQPDLTGICACRVAGIEKEGRNYEPGTGAGKWDGSRFPVPILSHSSALFFSPAAPQMRSRSRPSVLSHRPDQRINIVNLMPSHILFDTANRFNSRIRIKEIRRPNRNRRSPARINSSASSADAIPPIPIIGTFTACAT